MKKVLVVQHVRVKDADNEEVKMIGVFSTQATVNACIRELETQPGFRDRLDGFSVDEYELDKVEWKEGFGE